MGNLMTTTVMKILTLLFLVISFNTKAQTFEKSFQGLWASTSWTYNFYKDGTYDRVSMGHYGNTTIDGNYKIKSDTIILLNGFKKTDGTVNETYILDKDSMLIDLNLRYDYAPISKQKQNFHSSQKRLVKYPQTFSTNKNLKIELERVLNLAFNSNSIKEYYHFDKLPKRKLLIANYYYLDASIQVESLKSIYKPKEKITDDFYIEFKDINQNDNSIDIKITLHGEGVSIWFYYDKIDGKWISKEPFIIEN